MVDTGDGPDPSANYAILNRGKRHEYFTSCLPWPQKGQSVSLPLGSTAPLVSNGSPLAFSTNAGSGVTGRFDLAVGAALNDTVKRGGTWGGSSPPAGFITGGNAGTVFSGLYADLSQATAATINAIRTAFQVQKLFERDARGGTRYTEIIRSHFGAVSPDSRLQRPEYLGGSSVPVNIAPVAQTSASAISGSATPLAIS